MLTELSYSVTWKSQGKYFSKLQFFNNERYVVNNETQKFGWQTPDNSFNLLVKHFIDYHFLGQHIPEVPWLLQEPNNLCSRLLSDKFHR